MTKGSRGVARVKGDVMVRRRSRGAERSARRQAVPRAARAAAELGLVATGILGLIACSSGGPNPVPTVTTTAVMTETPAPVAADVKTVGGLTEPQAWGLCYALTAKSDVISGQLQPPLYADAIIEPRPDDTWFVGFNVAAAPDGGAADKAGRAWCLISGPLDNFTDVAHAQQAGAAAEDLDPQADVEDAQWTVSAS